MCNICNVIGSGVVNCLYALQKISGCIAFTILLGCLILTLMIVAGVGIGLGFNYCRVGVNMTNCTSKCYRRSGSEDSIIVRTGGDDMSEIIRGQNSYTPNLNPLMSLLAKKHRRQYDLLQELGININDDDAKILGLLKTLRQAVPSDASIIEK